MTHWPLTGPLLRPQDDVASQGTQQQRRRSRQQMGEAAARSRPSASPRRACSASMRSPAATATSPPSSTTAWPAAGVSAAGPAAVVGVRSSAPGPRGCHMRSGGSTPRATRVRGTRRTARTRVGWGGVRRMPDLPVPLLAPGDADDVPLQVRRTMGGGGGCAGACTHSATASPPPPLPYHSCRLSSSSRAAAAAAGALPWIAISGVQPLFGPQSSRSGSGSRAGSCARWGLSPGQHTRAAAAAAPCSLCRAAHRCAPLRAPWQERQRRRRWLPRRPLVPRPAHRPPRRTRGLPLCALHRSARAGLRLPLTGGGRGPQSSRPASSSSSSAAAPAAAAPPPQAASSPLLQPLALFGHRAGDPLPGSAVPSSTGKRASSGAGVAVYSDVRAVGSGAEPGARVARALDFCGGAPAPRTAATSTTTTRRTLPPPQGGLATAASGRPAPPRGGGRRALAPSSSPPLQASSFAPPTFTLPWLVAPPRSTATARPLLLRGEGRAVPRAASCLPSLSTALPRPRLPPAAPRPPWSHPPLPRAPWRRRGSAWQRRPRSTSVDMSDADVRQAAARQRPARARCSTSTSPPRATAASLRRRGAARGARPPRAGSSRGHWGRGQACRCCCCCADARGRGPPSIAPSQGGGCCRRGGGQRQQQLPAPRPRLAPLVHALCVPRARGGGAARRKREEAPPPLRRAPTSTPQRQQQLRCSKAAAAAPPRLRCAETGGGRALRRPVF